VRVPSEVRVRRQEHDESHVDCVFCVARRERGGKGRGGGRMIDG
jgi:hypothetical protein